MGLAQEGWERLGRASEGKVSQPMRTQLACTGTPAASNADRDLVALAIHDARCPGGPTCEGPGFEDYQRGDRLLHRLSGHTRTERR
jgi:hypothetical protein